MAVDPCRFRAIKTTTFPSPLPLWLGLASWLGVHHYQHLYHTALHDWLDGWFSVHTMCKNLCPQKVCPTSDLTSRHRSEPSGLEAEQAAAFWQLWKTFQRLATALSCWFWCLFCVAVVMAHQSNPTQAATENIKWAVFFNSSSLCRLPHVFCLSNHLFYIISPCSKFSPQRGE